MNRRKVAYWGAALMAAPVGLMAAAAPAAEAADEWCDTDPPVLIKTPKGRLVTVYALIGAQGLTTALLNDLAKISYTAAPASGGTLVAMTVTVRRTLLTGANVATRVTVSSGLLGLGTFYGSATGTAGVPMTVTFVLPVA